MTRLTITLSAERHRALKESAARRNTTIRRLIEESLDSCGIKTTDSAVALVAAAREQSRLADAAAVNLAVRETRAERGR